MKQNERIQYKVSILFRIIYILAFNVYSWYWLYKLIWVNTNTNWEDYVNWFFVTCGVHFFVIDYSKFWSKNVKSIRDIFNPDIEP
jgi:hypothetical protein